MQEQELRATSFESGGIWSMSGAKKSTHVQKHPQDCFA